VELGERAYGPDATGEEHAAIESRVSVVGERVLLMRELSYQTPFSVHVMFDRVEVLAREWDRFAYVADLTEARRPNPETRAALKMRVRNLGTRVGHVAIVVGNNVIMRAMARLFAHAMGLHSVSTHAERAEAIEEAGRAMGR
jgi:hypothetical protein